MFANHRRLAVLLAVAALAGCVSKSDFDALKKEAEGTRRDLLRTQKDAEKCAVDLAASQKRVDDLVAENKRKEDERSGKMMERDRRIAERLAQLPQAQEQAKLYAERIAILETDLAQCRNDEAAVRSRLAATEQELARVRTELGEKSLRLTQLEAELAALKKAKAEQDVQIEDMQAALGDMLKRKQEADARVAEFRALIAKFKALIDSGKLKVKVVDGRLVVELASDILFASGSATLSPDGLKAIREVGQILASIADRRFQVEGHTDNVPTRGGVFGSNWELGAARAINVVKTMVDAGLPAVRISAASYGDARPAQPNDTAEGKRANRRIEIVLMPDLSQMPGFEELKRAAEGR